MQDNSNNSFNNSDNNMYEFKTPVKQTTTTTTTPSSTTASNQLNTIYTTPLNNNVYSTPLNSNSDDNNIEEFKTPIKQTTSTSTTASNQLKTVYATPLNSNVYSTPQSVSSPFVHGLTPYNENKRLFDLNSSDVLPMPSSTTNKNVHSPPKSALTLGDIRNVCENKLLIIESNDINNIINSTNYKKKKVTQWFLDKWFEGNKEININIVLRTIFSVFCTLRKDNLLSSSIADQFQSFWNKLKKEKRNTKYNNLKMKKKKQDSLKDKKGLNDDLNVGGGDDVDKIDVASDDTDIDLSLLNIHEQF